MRKALEDRLTSALVARAELVRPEDIEHQTLEPRRPTPLWRRPAVVALVAAACVVAVVVPLATRGDHATDQPVQLDHDWPPPPHHTQPVQGLTDRLSGDIDGDGRPDLIEVSGHTLTVTLAAEPQHPLTESNPGTAGLVGLTDVGGPGQAVLVSTNDLGSGAEWQAIALRRGQLKLVLLHEPDQAGSIAVVPGYETGWLTPQGVAMKGVLDPMQRGERHLAVKASRLEVRSGRPVLVPVGHWCWDVVTQKVPAPCPDGVDDAFDPGPHGSLPPLLPRVDINDSISLTDTWHEGSTSLHFEQGSVKATSEFHQAYDVVGTIDGHDVSAPGGVFQPILFKRFIDLGHGVRGLAVDNNSGSAPSWNLLSFVDSRLVPLTVASGLNGLHPGTQVVDDHGQGRPATTWIGPRGQVFTSVQTGGPGQDELIRWQVTDGSGTRLAPVDLGRLCMNDYWGTYGTCPG